MKTKNIIILILSFVMTFVFIVSNQAHAFTPVRSQSAGLSKFISDMRERKISNPGQMMDLYGGRINVIQRKIPSVIDFAPQAYKVRYLYSPRWGWLDILHFTAAAWTNSIPMVHGYRVLQNGEGNERQQEKDNEPSRWDYEDLISNLLGVCFQEYLDTLTAEQSKDFVGQLEYWLKDHGFVDDPRTAQNWSKMSERDNRDDTTENHKYYPFHVPDNYLSLYNDNDRAIVDYLNGYLKWMERSRDDEVK